MHCWPPERSQDIDLSTSPGRKSATHKIDRYEIFADPVHPQAKGRPHYFTGETGMIRETCEDRHATASEPVIQG